MRSARQFLIILIFTWIWSGPTESQGLRWPVGYQGFDFPQEFGGRSLPGALVQISPNKGFRYLGHLVEDCGIDASAARPTPGIIAIPSFSYSRDQKVSFVAKLAAYLSFNAEATSNHTADIILGPTRDYSLTPLRLIRAAQENLSTLEKLCGPILKAKNVFWISDALMTDSLTFKFKRSDGVAVNLSVEGLEAVVTGGSLSAKISLTHDGGVEVRAPLYVAFRAAYPSELLRGTLTPFSINGQRQPKPTFGDEIYASPAN